MADRYWVGGSGTWNTTSTTNWSASPGGPSGASVPTSADSVFFDRTGTYTVTLTGALNCLDFNVSAGSVTFTSTGTISIAGSVSITNVTPTWSATGTLTFTATTSKTIATNGTSFSCSMTFNGVGGSWQLSSALTIGTTNTITLTNGTLNVNNQTLTAGLFSSTNSNTRTIAFGTGNITVTGTGTVWNTGTVTGLTVTGTPIVNVTNSTATATTVLPGALSEANSISFNFTAGTYTLTFLGSTSHTARNVSFSGFSGTWGATGSNVIVYGNLTLSTGMTLTSTTNIFNFGATSGSRTITTSGKTLDFPITFNGVGGTWVLQDAFTVGSTRTVNLTNGTLNLSDKTFTCGVFQSNNSNTRTLAFGTGNITVVSTGAVWNTGNVTGLTVTGTPTVNVTNNTATATTVTPGSLSEANSISFNFTAGTYILTLSVGNVNSLNFTGFSGSITGIPVNIYGDLTISTGMTINASTATTSFIATSGIKTITTNGKTFDFPITFNGVGGTWALQDALTQGSTRTTNLTAGTLDLNGKTYTSGSSFISSGTSVRNITFNAGTFVCTGTTTAFSASGSNLTTTKGTGEGYITLSNTTSNRTFAGGGFVYNCTLYVTVGNTATTITISGANTFRNIQTNATGLELFVSTIAFPASTTTTFLVSFGLNYISIGSSTPGTQATLSLESGTILALSMTITDSNATGGAIWKADKNSINGGNNSGWIFLTNIGGEFFVFF